MSASLEASLVMTDSQKQLQITDLAEVLQLLKRHGYSGVSYYTLGLFLGLSTATLDVIKENNKGDVVSCLRECLTKWLQKADNVQETKGGHGPTIYSLVSALRELGENGMADGIDMEMHPACKILARYASNQSLISALPQFAALLCLEKIIKELATNIPGETLLIQTKEAVCDDYQKLRALAKTLLKFEVTAVIGKAIMTEYGEIFCRDDLILNDCDRGLKIKFPLQLTSQFRSMRLQFGDTFVKVESILQTIPQPTIDNIKKSLRFSYNTLRPQLDLCKDMNDILELMSDNSSLDDISMLEFLVNKLNIEEAKLVVQKYKEVIEEFSKTELSKCLHERFSYASPLQCESVTIVVDRKTDDLTLDDVRRLSANLFDELSPNVRLNVVRDDNSFTITCSFPLILSEQLIRAALNNIDVLKENKVKRLTIGYCTVYEVNYTSPTTDQNEYQQTSSLSTSSGLSKQLMLSLSVQLISSKEEVTTLNEESKIMKGEAESLKERLDTKNKMLNVSMAENNRLKKIAAETSQLLQKKVSHLTEREKENEKLTEINKLLEEKLALFQSEKEKDEKQPLTVEYRSNKELKEQIFKENNENTKDEQRTEVEKILAEKEELQAQFDSYKRTMMAENEKLQTDLANARKEAEKIVTKMEELTYNIEIMKNEAMMTENDQITQLKLTRVPTLHDDWREPHTLPVEVLMTSFASHHKSNGYWYSPSFYSHKKGYKLCLRVRANGESEGSGTHLSIHIHLMRGDHDDTLKWPVRGKVKLVLLNRKHDENHFVEEIEFNDGSNPEATGRVINGIQISSGTAAFVGQGRAAFIPQDLLFQDYMKDDSIRIRITSVDLSGQGNSIPISVATSWPPIFEFRINNFSALQKSNGSYVSDYFYTHKKNNGYRFVFMVYPNGVGANKGKNVSIFAHLTKGENDDQLKFPFRGEITLQAVNCHANHDHAEKVI